MPTTTKMGIVYPSSTDLVKDGATAMGTISTTVDAKTGLVFISTTTFSGVSSQSLTANTFTSSFENYKLIFNFTALSASNQTITMKLRASGTDSSTGYYFERVRNENGSISGTRFSNNDTFFVGSYDTTSASRNYKEVNLYSPQLAVLTSYNSTGNYVSADASLKTETMGGYHSSATAYDSISIIPSSGTITGSVSVFGYNKG